MSELTWFSRHHAADSLDSWAGWPEPTSFAGGKTARALHAGKSYETRFEHVPAGDLLIVLALANTLSGDLSHYFDLSVNGETLPLLRRDGWPHHVLAVLKRGVITPGAVSLTITAHDRVSAEPIVRISSISLLPLHTGRFSMLWTSLGRALVAVFKGEKKMRWSIQDFPYSHFDGLGYLLEHHEARTAVLSRTFSTAYQYFQRKGKQLGHALLLATDHPPLPGTAFNLVSYHRDEHQMLSAALAQLKEENELLLFQIHEAQQELERLFGENEELMRRVESGQQYKTAGLDVRTPDKHAKQQVVHLSRQR